MVPHSFSRSRGRRQNRRPLSSDHLSAFCLFPASAYRLKGVGAITRVAVPPGRREVILKINRTAAPLSAEHGHHAASRVDLGRYDSALIEFARQTASRGHLALREFQKH
jgi:hypothetical protein